MRMLNKIILHCADTKPSMDIGVKEIKRWHIHERGWKDIGYHWVIRRDGKVEQGRPESVVGAHCSGYNTNSIGICLIGGMEENSSKPEDNFLPIQYESLVCLINEIRNRYPQYKLPIYGHNDFGNTSCPVFSVEKFLNDYNVSKMGD